RANTPRETLSGGSRVALTQNIPSPKFERIDIELSGDLLHLKLRGKSDLWRAKAAKGAVRRRIGCDSARGNAHIVATVRSERVNRTARAHNRCESHIRAT